MGSQRVIGADAVALIATLLRGEDDRWPIFLLGAGASFRSGVPTAAEAVKQIARIVYSERKLLGARPPERVKPSEWEPWLREQPWFNDDAMTNRVIDGNVVILDLRSGEYKILDEVATMMWRAALEGVDRPACVESIAEQFAAAPAEVATDFDRFLADAEAAWWPGRRGPVRHPSVPDGGTCG